MGIEEQIDRLIDAGDDILKALQTLNERVAEIAGRFSPVAPSEPPAKPKRWRYRKEHETIQPGDWSNAVRNPVGDWPPATGWWKTECVGMLVSEVSDQLRIACEVTDDAKEPPPQPEPEWREPVLPGDYGKECQFSLDGKTWFDEKLSVWSITSKLPWRSTFGLGWRFARIRKDA